MAPSWGIAIADEGYYSGRSDLLAEPLDPARHDAILNALRLGLSWIYADPDELAAERAEAPAIFRALAAEGKIQMVEPQRSRIPAV
jgi:hypothetical protein